MAPLNYPAQRKGKEGRGGGGGGGEGGVGVNFLGVCFQPAAATCFHQCFFVIYAKRRAG